MNEDQTVPPRPPAPEPPAPPDFRHIESINNLDTARMALRWALERLNNLQTLKDAAERKAAETEAALSQAEADRKDIQRVADLRGQDDTQRTAYYAKLEAYLTQQFAGKLDLAGLIQKEARCAELEALLESRRLSLEKEHEALREKLAADYKKATLEAQQEATAATARAQASVTESRKNLERDFAIRLCELTDREVRLRTEAEALTQRQAQFEAFSREQRARLELDIKEFHDSLQDQLRYRVETTERFLASRHEAESETWSREKANLLKEIAGWREKVLAYAERICALEKDLLEAREAAQRARRSPPAA